MDFSAIICPETGVSASEAAMRALLARDHLGGDETPASGASLAARRRAMIEDVRVLTGLMAGELVSSSDDPAPRFDASRRAAEAHRATLRSDEFAFHAALAMRALDRATRSE